MQRDIRDVHVNFVMRRTDMAVQAVSVSRFVLGFHQKVLLIVKVMAILLRVILMEQLYISVKPAKMDMFHQQMEKHV